MSALLTNVAELLKNFYIDPLRTAVNNESMVTELCTKDTDSVSGTNAIIAIHTARNGGVAFGSESGTIPTAGRQSYINVTVPTKKIWGTFEISAELQAASRDQKGAFANALKQEMVAIKDDIVNVQDKHFVLNGDGVLSAPTADPAATPNIPVTADGSVIYFEQGMKIDVYNNATTTHTYQGLEVINVNLATNTITVDQNVTIVAFATSIITLAGSIVPVTNVNLAMQGLGSILNTTTLFGVNPANVPTFRAINADTALGLTGAEDFNESRLEAILDTIKVEGGGMCPDFALTSYVNIRQYKEDIRDRERRQVDTIKFKSGRSAMAFDYEGKQVAIIGDRYMKPGHVFGWKQDHIVLYEARPLDWHAPNGDVLIVVPDKTLVRGVLYSLQELAPRIRNSGFFATDFAS